MVERGDDPYRFENQSEQEKSELADMMAYSTHSLQSNSDVDSNNSGNNQETHQENNK